MFLFDSKNKNQTNYLSGFKKTNNIFGKKIRDLTNHKSLSKEQFIEQLMILLIEADVGYNTANKICSDLSKKINNFDKFDNNQKYNLIIETIKELYNGEQTSFLNVNENGTTIILLVGVNGSGKTSTCAKLANKLKNDDHKVALVAADTFRAGAVEQLNRFAEKLNIPCICGKANQDPSSVLVDGCIYAKENNVDYLICDTAGRLQNKVNLMNELSKMYKVLGKQIEGAPHNAFLVIDANTGQNGLSQAKLFNEITKLDGIILTKNDGTSKGGIILAIKNEIDVPVKYVTFGEELDNIEEFNLDLYIESILGEMQNEL